ncbi:AraC family transcriptional regulator [Weissella diestrammenae]|uniref:AraC family transcriptional regulator n=1 Tax=Weissella diestrammenae TaxID=1162633 RepID=A0A7G9T4J6_9LACO|nr:AraC family transcriptional regulator [Weissella diestrammenae]MCM0582047.1 AraC family transcriptional regulator [Weissella diestrammenae]QNN75021.1 AraC family transcriptional regulator [Weissella diestrammenae]
MAKSSVELLDSLPTRAKLFFNSCGVKQTFPFDTFEHTPNQNYVIQFIQSGEGYVFFNHQRYQLRPGTCFLVAPGDSMMILSSLNRPLTYGWLSFSGTDVQHIVQNQKSFSPNYIFNSVWLETYVTLIDQALKFDKSPQPSQQDLDYLMTNFINTFITDTLENELQPLSVTFSSYAQQAQHFIEQHYCEDISIANIADAIKIDRSYLSRLFHDQFGMAPKSWLIGIRFNRACQLLQKTNLSIAQISDRTGFNSLCVFSRAFSKIFNMTPSDYRKLSGEFAQNQHQTLTLSETLI